MTCLAPACDRAVLARGLCRKHYERVRKFGTIDLPGPAERLAGKLVAAEGGCLEWSGCRDRWGYGSMRVGKMVRVHRLAWELAYGPIPDGMVICHHCDNPPCCNVDHLFLGTMADNNADRDRKGRTRFAEVHYNLLKAECVHGHPFDARNTYVEPNGKRRCRTCVRQRQAAQRRKRVAA